MQDGSEAVWSILYVSVAFFPSLKQNFITYRSYKVSSHKMISNNILNFQESMTILNAYYKKVWKLFEQSSYITTKRGKICLDIHKMWIRTQ